MLCPRLKGHYHGFPFIKFYLKCHDILMMLVVFNFFVFGIGLQPVNSRHTVDSPCLASSAYSFSILAYQIVYPIRRQLAVIVLGNIEAKARNRNCIKSETHVCYRLELTK